MTDTNCKVKLICGVSGAGKTTYLCRHLIEQSQDNPDGRYYMIVPEQYTLETQKTLSKLHPDGGIMDIDILSFVRLTYRVFEELHIKQHQVLEDVGKTMVIRHLLEEHKDELEMFGSARTRAGFHQELRSMICELFQYGIEKEDVKAAMMKLPEHSILYKKLKDMLLIYTYFEDYMEGHYIVAEQLPTLASRYLEDSKKLRGATLCFDGFTGFTPVQYVMLEKLMHIAGEICISVTMPEPDIHFKEPHHLFHMSYEMFQRIETLAAGIAGVELCEPVFLAGNSSLLPADLAHLEQTIFHFPYSRFQGKPEHIEIYAIDHNRSEVAFAASEIRRLVQTEGCRYRDIAVVTGDLENTAYLVEEIFPRYDLPFFIDRNIDMRQNPLVIWALSLWRIVTYDYQYADVFQYLKCGLSGALSDYEVSALENYALARGIHSRFGWEKPSDNPYIEALRVRFMTELDGFHALLTGHSVKGILTALYRFGVSLHLEEKLREMAETFDGEKQYVRAKQYEQVYEKLMSLYDKIADILGETELEAEAFLHILEAGVSELDIGVLPAGIDQVVVGDIIRTRLSDIKVLMFLNVNDGIIPSNGTRGMILSDADREELSGTLTLAATSKQKSFEEQFYLYLLLTKPKQKLYMTYHFLTDDMKECRPSYVLSRIQTLFPALSVQTVEGCDLDRIYSPEDGRRVFGALLQQYLMEEDVLHPYDEELLVTLSQMQLGIDEKLLMSGLSYPAEEPKLSSTLTDQLYGNPLTASISKLEKYASCAYAYFLQYGLRLKEKQLFTVDVADTGTILHSVMEQVFRYFKENGEGVRLADEAECIAKTKEILGRVIEEQDYKDIFDESARSRNLYLMLERVAVRAVTTLKQQLSYGQMQPEAFELAFGEDTNYASFKLSNEAELTLRGVVDRVDVFADTEKRKLYLQVIDYKSGDKKIDYTKLFYGTQLQLMVYMNVVKVWARERYQDMEIVPLGMYYFHLHDPLVVEDGKNEVDALRFKEMRLSGETIDDPELAKYIDHTPGSVIPAALTKDEVFKQTAPVLSGEQMEKVCEYAYRKVQDIGEEVYAGDICVKPYKQGNFTGCDYCPYAEVCLFEAGSRQAPYRYFRKKTKEDIIGYGMDEGTATGN